MTKPITDYVVDTETRIDESEMVTASTFTLGALRQVVALNASLPEDTPVVVRFFTDWRAEHEQMGSTSSTPLEVFSVNTFKLDNNEEVLVIDTFSPTIDRIFYGEDA